MKIKIIAFSLLLIIITAKAQEWEFVGLDSLAIYHLAVSGDTIYAGTVDLNNNPYIKSGLYYSIDQGNNWVQLDSIIGDGAILGLEMFAYQTIYIIKCPCQAPLAGTLYKTTNNGQSWSSVNNISTNPIKWFGISPFNPNEIYAIDVLGLGGGRYFNSLFKSTNRGNSWESIGSFPGSSHGSEIIFTFDLADSTILYVVVDDRFGSLYLYKSTDEGSNWLYVSYPPVTKDIYTDYFIYNRIYLFPGPYVSDEGGQSWFKADSGLTENSYYISFYQDKLTTRLLYILLTDGLYESRNDTFYWNLLEGSENLPLDFPSEVRNLKNIIINEEKYKIYLGTSEGLFRKDILTNVSNEKEKHINRFLLEQNYPNPFNPHTKIKYQLPENTHTILKVYDLLGNELATLVNGEKQEGYYEVEFDGKNFSSGVYIYTLITGSQITSKKMVLIK